MIRAAKRVLLALCMTCVLVAAGCGNANDTSEDNQNTNSDGILLYYANEAWSGYSPRRMDTDQLASEENLIDMVMTDMLEGGEASTAQPPVPYGATYQRYNYDGTGTVNIIFTVDWESVDTYQMVLGKAAFVKTLCQLDSVDKVTYELVDIVDEANVVKEEYTEDSYADIDDMLSSEKIISVYLPDITGQKLVEREAELDYSAADSMAEQVMSTLRLEYDGAVSPLNGRTAVKSITVADGVCTVTFNEFFSRGKDGVSNEISVYSIVDSLCQLDNIQKVQFVIENSDSVLGDLSLEEPLAADYTNVKN